MRSMYLDYDDEVVFQARRYLFERARDDDGRPFMLTVSSDPAARPLSVPARVEHWGCTDDEDIDLPAVPAGQRRRGSALGAPAPRLRRERRRARRGGRCADGAPGLLRVPSATSTTSSAELLRPRSPRPGSPRTPSSCSPRPRRHARRARHVVQDELLRALRAGALIVHAPRLFRSRRVAQACLARRPAADPGRDRPRRRARRLRDAARGPLAAPASVFRRRATTRSSASTSARARRADVHDPARPPQARPRGRRPAAVLRPGEPIRTSASNLAADPDHRRWSRWEMRCSRAPTGATTARRSEDASRVSPREPAPPAGLRPQGRDARAGQVAWDYTSRGRCRRELGAQHPAIRPSWRSGRAFPRISTGGPRYMTNRPTPRRAGAHRPRLRRGGGRSLSIDTPLLRDAIAVLLDSTVEREQIFWRSWQFLCHAEQLREPGSYVAADVQGRSIVAVRGERRRAAGLLQRVQAPRPRAARGSGTGARITCPYHAWVYNLDGGLRRARRCELIENFDPADIASRPSRSRSSATSCSSISTRRRRRWPSRPGPRRRDRLLRAGPRRPDRSPTGSPTESRPTGRPWSTTSSSAITARSRTGTS